MGGANSSAQRKSFFLKLRLCHDVREDGAVNCGLCARVSNLNGHSYWLRADLSDIVDVGRVLDVDTRCDIDDVGSSLRPSIRVDINGSVLHVNCEEGSVTVVGHHRRDGGRDRATARVAQGRST